MRPTLLDKALPAKDLFAIRLGRIGFINTVPVYHGLQQALPKNLQSQIHVVSNTPMGLNKAIVAGHLELSPVSTAWYAQHQDQLTLLPGLSVSSLGSVESVLLVSDFGLHQWQGQPIAVPDDSATSVAVLRALIQHHSGIDPLDAFVVYPAHLQEQALRDYPAVLTIGDRALAWLHGQNTAALTPGLTTKQPIDLATAWQAFTGEPLVFAVWVARSEWLKTHETEAIQVMDALIKSKNEFLSSEPSQHEACKTLVSATALSESILKHYWTQSLDYGWSEGHQASVERLSALMTHTRVSCLV